MRLFQRVGLLLTCCSLFKLYAAEVPPGTELSPQQILRIDLMDQPEQIDPQFSQTVYEAWILEDLFEPLLSTDAHGNPCPGAAARWESNADKTVWTFHLRPEGRWSNGEPVTAEHFVYTCRRLVRSMSAIGQSAVSDWKWKNAQRVRDGMSPAETLGVEAVDDYTLEFQLEAPVLNFPISCGRELMPVYPITAEENVNPLQPSNRNSIVTNGAYCNLWYHPNLRFEVDRNPYYWDNDKTVLEAVHYYFTKENSPRYLRFETGRMDLSDIRYRPHEKAAFYARFKDKILEVQGLAARFVFLNIGAKELQNSKFRLALSMVIDREALLTYIDEPGLPVYTLLHPRSLASGVSPPGWVKLPYLERCRRARELIGGMRPDCELTLVCGSVEGMPTYLQKIWKEGLGITLNLQAVEFSEMLDLRKRGQFELLLHSYVLENLLWDSAFEGFEGDSPKNYSGYRSAKFSHLWAKVRDPRLSEAKRERYVKRLNLLLAEEVPELPLYFLPSRFLVQPYVGGVCKDHLLCRFKAKDLYILKNDIADFSFYEEETEPKDDVEKAQLRSKAERAHLLNLK